MNQPTASGGNQLRSIARRAMTERGPLPDFSPAVLAETAVITEVPANPSVRDLRSLPWVSVPGGAVKILVAVADVDALVKRGSAIDGHARAKTTSVYTPAEAFPMLPEKLSTDLTSLREASAGRTAGCARSRTICAWSRRGTRAAAQGL